MMYKEILDMMYEPEKGIASRFRDGDEELSNEEKDKLIKFATELNTKMKNGYQVDSKEIILETYIVYLLMLQNDEALCGFADKFVATLEDGISC